MQQSVIFAVNVDQNQASQNEHWSKLLKITRKQQDHNLIDICDNFVLSNNWK